ncbi:uncharacterized protein JN550_006997 [Neoarthrinium moseri]|uniref:uncharacterized protein n=1 Tax=Neoarthrinium moseri TaxID=1658444 RepID=UPI001FDB96EC|nr:uncharacterized protein JN550_006997 [Neoarthrinium moseri]KAI1867266.1 hypothetical protein JN550_006997 [Neoarthrinium moseri]
MSSNDHAVGENIEKTYEPHPDPQALTGHRDQSKNSKTGVDYEPHPERSVYVSPEKENIVKRICSLYSGSASKDDIMPGSGIPKIFKSESLKTEILSPSDTDLGQIVFKLQQRYTARAVNLSNVVNSLVSLSLDQQGKVKYHKDMWNEKDHSHEDIGKFFN